MEVKRTANGMFDARQEGDSYLRKVISRFCSGASSAISLHDTRPRALCRTGGMDPAFLLTLPASIERRLSAE